eukprot:5358965-Pleurochrysis_carterae.AAC.1
MAPQTCVRYTGKLLIENESLPIEVYPAVHANDAPVERLCEKIPIHISNSRSSSKTGTTTHLSHRQGPD